VIQLYGTSDSYRSASTSPSQMLCIDGITQGGARQTSKSPRSSAWSSSYPVSTGVISQDTSYVRQCTRPVSLSPQAVSSPFEPVVASYSPRAAKECYRYLLLTDKRHSRDALNHPAIGKERSGDRDIMKRRVISQGKPSNVSRCAVTPLRSPGETRAFAEGYNGAVTEFMREKKNQKHCERAYM
jgi:hypothetical protein